MSIYVDELITWSEHAYRGKDRAQAARVGARNGHQWCHMFADKADCPELHVIAGKIGMRREWFQGDHYDLTPGRRKQAVKAGAIEVTREQAVEIWRQQKLFLQQMAESIAKDSVSRR
jgi:hypothetical protein